MYKVAVILLNYNSNKDLFESVPQVLSQKGIELYTIIVDNASKSDTVKELISWFKNNLHESIIIKPENLKNLKKEIGIFKNFLILNDKNLGFSGGNNLGIKLADLLDIDAVLIMNPDIRIQDERYLRHLADILFQKDCYYIVASRVVGIDGKEQNPLRELTFIEELCWLCNYIFKKSYIISYNKIQINEVPKVCGCCFMIKMSFLRRIGYLDDNVFMYSEEPILAKLVKKHKGKIIFTPFKKVIHAHKKEEKGNVSKRMLLFIKSRLYYIWNYSDYNFLQKVILSISYYILYVFYYFRLIIKFNK